VKTWVNIKKLPAKKVAKRYSDRMIYRDTGAELNK
jgi:hypothetical protein